MDYCLDERFVISWNLIVSFTMRNIYNEHNFREHQFNGDGTIEKVLQLEVFPAGGLVIEF
jgi:hypothetical protein